MTDKKAIVYTDGACINNGLHNSCAGWSYVFYTHDLYEYDGVSTPTNNRAELTAVLKAIQATKRDLKVSHLIIKTDSEYSINCINFWIDKWKRYQKKDGTWTRPDGEEVKNQDLLKELEKEKNEKGFKLTIEYVRGHSEKSTEDAKWNTIADILSKIPCQETDMEKLKKRSRGSKKDISHIIKKAHSMTYSKVQKQKQQSEKSQETKQKAQPTKQTKQPKNR